jgi:hypothetical protein
LNYLQNKNNKIEFVKNRVEECESNSVIILFFGFLDYYRENDEKKGSNGYIQRNFLFKTLEEKEKN